MSVVGREPPHGRQILANAPTSKSANGHWIIRRTERRRSNFAKRFVHGTRHNANTVHIRCLALIRRHAKSGVAFNMLNRPEVFANSQLHVFRRNVILHVEECLNAFLAETCDIGFPMRGDPVGRGFVCLRRGKRTRRRARMAFQGRHNGIDGAFKRAVKSEQTRRRPD